MERRRSSNNLRGVQFTRNNKGASDSGGKKSSTRESTTAGEKRKSLSQPTIASSFDNARKKRKVTEVEEEEYTLNKHDINDTEKEKLTADLMRFVLFKDHQKLPVLKKDIIAKVLGEYAKKRNVTNIIIKEAQRRFEDIFGFKMVEVQKSAPRNSRKAAIKPPTSSGTYILINMLPQDVNADLLNWSFISPFTGLIMTILCLIYLNNSVIEQELLYQLLSKLGLGNLDHPLFNNWKDLIEKQFVKQLYLYRNKVAGKFDKKGEPVYEYRFGPRAKLEITNAKILQFISRVFGDELTPLQLEQLAANSDDDDDDDDFEYPSDENI